MLDNFNQPRGSTVGILSSGLSTQITLDNFITGVDSVAALRLTDPISSGDRIYLKGVRQGSTRGEGYWEYDAADTTSVDNGWFIVVTATNKRLKRVGLNEFLRLDWAGLDDGADWCDAVQTAVTWIRTTSNAQKFTYGLPPIVVSGGNYSHSKQIKSAPYVCFVAFGNVRVWTTAARTDVDSLFLIDSSTDTSNFYHGHRGANFPRMFSGIGSKWRFAHTLDPAVLPVASRPSLFKFTSTNQQAHNNNMLISDIECENLLTTLEIVAVNFWGVRVEDCVLSGHYGVYFASGGNNSGERISIVNCWIGGRHSAIYAGATNFQVNLDSCSSDFIGSTVGDPGHIVYKPVPGWFAITFNDCHMEQFTGYIIEGVGYENIFYTFRGTTILPDGTGKSPSPSRKLFNCGGTILMDDCFVEWTQAAYDQLDGLLATGATAVIIVRNNRSYHTRDMYFSRADVLSRVTDLSTEPLNSTGMAVGAQTTFSITNKSGITATVEDTDNTLIDTGLGAGTTRTLKITATADYAYIYLKGNEYIPVESGNWYSPKIVAVSNVATAITGRFELRMEWYDDAKVAISNTMNWYDNYSAIATATITGGTVYGSRANKRIGQIYQAMRAPSGARYCRLYYSVAAMNTGQAFYITEHLVYKSAKGA